MSEKGKHGGLFYKHLEWSFRQLCRHIKKLLCVLPPYDHQLQHPDKSAIDAPRMPTGHYLVPDRFMCLNRFWMRLMIDISMLE